MKQSSCPPSLSISIIERTFDFSIDKIDYAWEKLQKRETFVDGQVFPYRVEFDNDQQFGTFKSGELNIHHGPLLSVHGEIGEMNDHYRGLDYFYGSYVFSFRIVRPTQLEFFREGNQIKMKLHCYVAPWFKSIWELGNKLFWSSFHRTLST